MIKFYEDEYYNIAESGVELKKPFVDKFEKILSKDVDDVSWIAGGAVLSAYKDEKINDIDIFTHDVEKAKHNYFHDIPESEIIKTPYSWTATIEGYRTQLIIFNEYNTIEDCLDSFDFTICTAAYIGGCGVVCGTSFVPHADARKLVIRYLTNPLSTMKRVVKYVANGYTIDNKELYKVMKRVSGMNINWPDDLDNYVSEDIFYN